MIPSASGGLGHIGRTAALGRALRGLDPRLSVGYVLNADRLRPQAGEAARATGFPTRVMPPRRPENRREVVGAALGEADVIVDDTQGELIHMKALLPRARWVHIPMFPLGDELFMNWPALTLIDALLWAYPPGLDLPRELEFLGDRIHRVGPFLNLDGVPGKAEARGRFGLADGEEVVLYAPRGMTFGWEFGVRVLQGVYAGVEARRRAGHATHLVLAATNEEELRFAGLPFPLPSWVTRLGTVAPPDMLALIRAADVTVSEGSNMTQEAAALGTPVVMVPGTIHETWLLGTRLGEVGGVRLLWIEHVSPDTLADQFAALLGDPAGRARQVEIARTFVGAGGAQAAARAVLGVMDRPRRPVPDVAPR